MKQFQEHATLSGDHETLFRADDKLFGADDTLFGTMTRFWVPGSATVLGSKMTHFWDP